MQDRKYLKWKLLAGEKPTDELVEKIPEPLPEVEAETVEETSGDNTVAELVVEEESEDQPDDEDILFTCPKCGKEYKDEVWYNKHVEKDDCEEE